MEVGEGGDAVVGGVVVGGEVDFLGVDIAAVVVELYGCPAEAVGPYEVFHRVVAYVYEALYVGVEPHHALEGEG